MATAGNTGLLEWALAALLLGQRGRQEGSPAPPPRGPGSDRDAGETSDDADGPAGRDPHEGDGAQQVPPRPFTVPARWAHSR